MSSFRRLTNSRKRAAASAGFRSCKSPAKFPGALAELEDLNLDLCRLESLPEGVGGRAELRILSLYHYRLTRVPESVWQLEQLRTLNLAANGFASLHGLRCPNRWAPVRSHLIFMPATTLTEPRL
jgi:hypothetical protein